MFIFNIVIFIFNSGEHPDSLRPTHLACQHSTHKLENYSIRKDCIKQGKHKKPDSISVSIVAQCSFSTQHFPVRWSRKQGMCMHVIAQYQRCTIGSWFDENVPCYVIRCTAHCQVWLQCAEVCIWTNSTPRDVACDDWLAPAFTHHGNLQCCFIAVQAS